MFSTTTKAISLFIIALDVLDLYIIYNLMQIEKEKSKCSCAKNANNKQLISVASITVIIRSIILGTFQNDPKAFDNTINMVLLMVGLLLNYYYAYLMINYTSNLKENQCNCLATTDDILYYYGVVSQILLALAGLIIFLAFVPIF